jgi:hypothetical protein
MSSASFGFRKFSPGVVGYVVRSSCLKPDFSVCLAAFVVIALLTALKKRATLRRPPKSVWVWTVGVRVAVGSSISVAWASVFVPESRRELLLDSVSEDMAQP